MLPKSKQAGGEIMEHRKMTDAELKKAKKLAEKMKGKKGIDNPHALARWMIEHRKKTKSEMP